MLGKWSKLEEEYDPEGEDYLIEKAVSLIESIRMNYFKRVAVRIG